MMTAFIFLLALTTNLYAFFATLKVLNILEDVFKEIPVYEVLFKRTSRADELILSCFSIIVVSLNILISVEYYVSSSTAYTSDLEYIKGLLLSVFVAVMVLQYNLLTFKKYNHKI